MSWSWWCELEGLFPFLYSTLRKHDPYIVSALQLNQNGSSTSRWKQYWHIQQWSSARAFAVRHQHLDCNLDLGSARVGIISVNDAWQCRMNRISDPFIQDSGQSLRRRLIPREPHQERCVKRLFTTILYRFKKNVYIFWGFPIITHLLNMFFVYWQNHHNTHSSILCLERLI